MSEIIIDHLRGRIKEAQEEYGRTTKKRIELTQLEQKLFKEVEAYQLALEGEMRRNGIPVHAQSETVIANSHTIAPLNGQGSAKAIIASHIREAGPAGTTHKNILGFLKSHGTQVHRNYPYVVVAKLKRGGMVKGVDGKLVWQDK